MYSICQEKVLRVELTFVPLAFISIQHIPLMNKIFLTGLPGVGKTTCIIKAVESISQSVPTLTLHGFYTRECRDNSGNSGPQRIGFDIVEYQDNTEVVVPLARVGSTKPTVGKYSVLLQNIQDHVIPSLQERPQPTATTPALTVIDEVGKMELLCPGFFPAVWNHLNLTQTEASSCSLGTLPMLKKPNHQVEKIMARHDVLVLLVTNSNRDALTKDLTTYLRGLLLSNKGEENTSKDDDGTSLLENYQYQPSPPSKQQQHHHKNRQQRHPKNGATDAPSESQPQESSSSSPPLRPCGPLVSTTTPPRILLLGETASAMPDDPALAYHERSMWKVLSKIVGVPNKNPPDSSEDYYLALQQATLDLHAIAIWDVLSNVHVRPPKGHKKAVIVDAAPNDLPTFLTKHASIQVCCFIGSKAYQRFRKHYLKDATTQNQYTMASGRTLDLMVLPSSSGANRMPLTEKVAQWQSAFEKYTSN